MVKIIAGLMGGSVAGGSSSLSSTNQLQDLLNLCLASHVSELDTARVYGNGQSEQLLGSVDSGLLSRFSVHTKAPGFFPNSLTSDKIVDSCSASLAALKRDDVDLYYFHGPDRQTPMEESCRAINLLHREGKIKAFGVSNFRADEVQEILDICTRNKWILPSVYQGGYNPLNRAGETALFPLLRKHGIAFYAYSPLGGGYFSRSKTQLLEPPQGSRMDQMPVFKSIYVNDDSLPLHDLLTIACSKEGISLKQSTLRWVSHECTESLTVMIEQVSAMSD